MQKISNIFLQVHLLPTKFLILFLKAESVGSFLTLSS